MSLLLTESGGKLLREDGTGLVLYEPIVVLQGERAVFSFGTLNYKFWADVDESANSNWAPVSDINPNIWVPVNDQSNTIWS